MTAITIVTPAVARDAESHTALVPAGEGHPLVLPFAAIRRSDVPIVGGKGANLGEMAHIGLPLPPGFVLTIDAYARFVAENDLAPRFATALAGLDADDSDALNATAARLRTLVMAGCIPTDVREAVLEAYRHLAADEHTEEPLVAVRSSATAEDTAQFSFAGMFESFLGVRGPYALLDRVKACWASTFGGRVLFYRVKQGLPVEMRSRSWCSGW